LLLNIKLGWKRSSLFANDEENSFICLAQGGLDGGAEGDEEKLEFIFSKNLLKLFLFFVTDALGQPF
jgi:hypothetical protein